MALRNIVTEGDEVLRKKSREVTAIDDRILTLLDDMIETMRHQEGVGIAAPQVGVLKRIFVVEVDGVLYELINPEIIETKGSIIEDEACLSVPAVVGVVERPTYVKIKGLNRKGEDVIYEGTELLAKAFCHENDHLDGVLFIDKALEIHEME